MIDDGALGTVDFPLRAVELNLLFGSFLLANLGAGCFVFGCHAVLRHVWGDIGHRTLEGLYEDY